MRTNNSGSPGIAMRKPLPRLPAPTAPLARHSSSRLAIAGACAISSYFRLSTVRPKAMAPKPGVASRRRTAVPGCRIGFVAELLERLGLVDEHNRDVIANWIDQPARFAHQAILARVELHFALALGAGKYVEQLLAHRHRQFLLIRYVRMAISAPAAIASTRASSASSITTSSRRAYRESGANGNRSSFTRSFSVVTIKADAARAVSPIACASASVYR